MNVNKNNKHMLNMIILNNKLSHYEVDKDYSSTTVNPLEFLQFLHTHN